ncbi:MAG: glucosamine--fructose-6-phosphate aminotransferase [Gammaproteobacteria bacterium]|nr:glucosamine--fructose-6-phosphate aminotransferase [Gammaproteobacteria bacterium]MDH5593221.1 glucosamine--fructose-6-phosphate aminotransferase [Gammaproteobacteria bacterium]MDH5613877.1 glucosamine--fructose-6-phosphate aminotransferase [Gammaproteobacteria bacterium]
MLSMPDFQKSVEAWGTKQFSQVLKCEIESLASGILPLDKATTQGGVVEDHNITVTILGSVEDESTIIAKAGVFFGEIVGGCNCSEEPVTHNVYCEIEVFINKISSKADIQLL